jgi:hypothetical protein
MQACFKVGAPAQQLALQGLVNYKLAASHFSCARVSTSKPGCPPVLPMLTNGCCVCWCFFALASNAAESTTTVCRSTEEARTPSQFNSIAHAATLCLSEIPCARFWYECFHASLFPAWFVRPLCQCLSVWVKFRRSLTQSHFPYWSVFPVFFFCTGRQPSHVATAMRLVCRFGR